RRGDRDRGSEQPTPGPVAGLAFPGGKKAAAFANTRCGRGAQAETDAAGRRVELAGLTERTLLVGENPRHCIRLVVAGRRRALRPAHEEAAARQRRQRRSAVDAARRPCWRESPHRSCFPRGDELYVAKARDCRRACRRADQYVAHCFPPSWEAASRVPASLSR